MPRTQSNTSRFFEIALLVLVGIFVVRIIWPAKGAAVGGTLPKLDVAGWLNGPGPTQEELSGKVVVIDFWATWCGHCIAAMPELTKLHGKLSDQGVVLLGLTGETAGQLPEIDAVLKAHPNAKWPVGFGADSILKQLGIQAFPTYVLFDRSGTAVWSGPSLSRLESELTKLLATGE